MKPLKSVDSISYNGKTIITVDITNNKPDETVTTLREAQQQIALSPRKSVLLMTDVTNAVYNDVSAKAIKDYASANSPYVKASAVVGADGFRAAVLTAVRILTKRNIKTCKNREEAMMWLASQD